MAGESGAADETDVTSEDGAAGEAVVICEIAAAMMRIAMTAGKRMKVRSGAGRTVQYRNFAVAYRKADSPVDGLKRMTLSKISFCPDDPSEATAPSCAAR